MRELSFTFSRSSGPGGQNVNKVNTKVTLIWDLELSPSISEQVKKRFRLKFSRFINSDGLVKIVSDDYRVQSRNIKACVDRLESMLKEVARPPKKRIKTKPTKSSIEKRIEIKKKQGEIKKNRKKVDY